MKAIFNILHVAEGKVYVEVDFNDRVASYESLDVALNDILEEDPTVKIIFN